MQADTSRVVWSWSFVDPSALSDITQHENQGTTSLNLLGGLNEPREDRSGAASFVIRNENVSVFQHGLESHGYMAQLQLLTFFCLYDANQALSITSYSASSASVCTRVCASSRQQYDRYDLRS